MNKQEFVENIRKQFVDADDITLTMDMNFRQIESYDSLTGMTIMVMIKDIYGVDLSDSEYKTQKTVNDLFDLVESKING
jgi:acyl carrier protein